MADFEGDQYSFMFRSDLELFFAAKQHKNTNITTVKAQIDSKTSMVWHEVLL